MWVGGITPSTSAFASTASSSAALNGESATYQAAPVAKWNAKVKYAKGTEVKYGGVIYVAKWPSKNKKPGKHLPNWMIHAMGMNKVKD